MAQDGLFVLRRSKKVQAGITILLTDTNSKEKYQKIQLVEYQMSKKWMIDGNDFQFNSVGEILSYLTQVHILKQPIVTKERIFKNTISVEKTKLNLSVSERWFFLFFLKAQETKLEWKENKNLLIPFLNVHETFLGYTPLHYATEREDLLLCKEFLANGADKTEMNYFGMTALDIANCSRNSKIRKVFGLTEELSKKPILERK